MRWQCLECAAVCLLAAASVRADVINVDFNSPAYQGLAVAPDPAGNTAVWNSVAPVATNNGGNWYVGSYTSAALVDSSGAATGVEVNLTAYGWAWNYPYSWSATSNAAGLMSNGIEVAPYSWGSPNTYISISGLVPDRTYSLYLYEQQGTNDSNIETESVFGGTPDIATNAASDGDRENEGFVLGDNYVLYSGLKADGTGTISGYVVCPIRDGYGALNGFQLVSAVPEPGTLALLAAGLLAPLAYAWRKRK